MAGYQEGMINYSVYLLKENVEEPSEAFTEKALSMFPVAAEQLQLNVDHEYDEVEAYAFFKEPELPKWGRIYAGVAELPDQVAINRSGSLFFAREGGRWFAFTFGDGFHYLDKRKVHMDFGLRTAVNMLDVDNVKSREAVDISRSQRGATQAALPTAFRDLGDYDTITIVKSISGKLEEAGTVSGAASLKFASQKGICELSEDLYGSLTAYSSTSYRRTDFAVIDKLQPVKDKTYIELLNNTLATAVGSNSGEVELVVPILLSHQNDVSYIRFMSIDVKPPPEFIDASVENYLEAVPTGTTIDSEALKRHKLMAHDHTGAIVHYASVHKCIVGTVESDISGQAKKYVINEGEWFVVSDDFKTSVDQFFEELRNVDADNEFSPLRIIEVEKKGHTSSGFESEADYNARVADENGLVLLDRKLISTPGVPGPGLEFCDVLDVAGRRLIHVKKGSTQSSVLSHFFNQGVNPMEYYRGDPEFAERVIEKIRAESEEAATVVETSDISEFSIHYVILDYPRADGSFNVPFFSRITLFDKAKSFRANSNGASISFVLPEEDQTS